MNPTDDEVEQIKLEIDEDGSGEIDFEEFLEIMNCKTLRFVNKQQRNNKMTTVFPTLDECKRSMIGSLELGIHSKG